MFFLVFVPFLTALIYLVVRGGGMRERALAAEAEARQQMDSYIRETAALAGRRARQARRPAREGHDHGRGVRAHEGEAGDVSLAGRRVLITGAARGSGPGPHGGCTSAARASLCSGSSPRSSSAWPRTAAARRGTSATSATATGQVEAVGEAARLGRAGVAATADRRGRARRRHRASARPARTAASARDRLARRGRARAVARRLQRDQGGVEALGNTCGSSCGTAPGRRGVLRRARHRHDAARVRDRGRRAHRPPRRAVTRSRR